MERFYQVPFDQFQNELNEWFRRSYADAVPEAFNDIGAEAFPEKLIQIANKIFNVSFNK